MQLPLLVSTLAGSIFAFEYGDSIPPLRCPEEGLWLDVFANVSTALQLLQTGDAVASRSLLGIAIESATQDLHAAFSCPIGVATAYRTLALAHISDPAASSTESMWKIALNLALRFQQLASGWLIYAYNIPAKLDSSFIDDSRWPITTQEFDNEHHSVAAALDLQTGKALSDQTRPNIHRTQRIPDLKLAIVSICSYPKGSLLPALATSVHRLYASRHGYDYIGKLNASSADRPPAWGKIKAMLEILEDGKWDWVIWIDCDLFFMDLDTTIDSLMLRYGSRTDLAEVSWEGLDSHALDPNLQLMFTEDSQMLNTAIFLMRKSKWSLDLLQRVWGPQNSPFINHTWWEQASFAQELLGMNHIRLADITYGLDGVSGLPDKSCVYPYPTQVRLVPQFEMNSYHPISSRIVGDTWAPGKFVLSFNGAQSLSGPTVAKVLHANYYELFCTLNGVQKLCDLLTDEQFAPWLA